MGGRQEIPASRPSSAEAAVETAAPPRLHLPDTNLPQRRRGNEAAVAGFLVLAAREARQAPQPAAAATTSHSDEQGCGGGPSSRTKQDWSHSDKGEDWQGTPVDREQNRQR